MSCLYNFYLPLVKYLEDDPEYNNDALHAAAISGRIAEYALDCYAARFGGSAYQEWFKEHKYIVNNPYPRPRVPAIEATIKANDKKHPYNVQKVYEAKMSGRARINDNSSWHPPSAEDLHHIITGTWPAYLDAPHDMSVLDKYKWNQ